MAENDNDWVTMAERDNGWIIADHLLWLNYPVFIISCEKAHHELKLYQIVWTDDHEAKYKVACQIYTYVSLLPTYW